MAFVLCGLATLWTATAALAPPLCRPDRNGDGHPLFAAFSQGQAVETPTGNSGAVLMGYTLADMNNDGRPDVVTSLLRNTTATTANTVVAVGLNDGDGRPASRRRSSTTTGSRTSSRSPATPSQRISGRRTCSRAMARAP
jgi:hypothetical protein